MEVRTCGNWEEPVAYCWPVKSESVSSSVLSDWPLATPWTVAHRAAQSMGFPRQPSWNWMCDSEGRIPLIHETAYSIILDNSSYLDRKSVLLFSWNLPLFNCLPILPSYITMKLFSSILDSWYWCSLFLVPSFLHSSFLPLTSYIFLMTQNYKLNINFMLNIVTFIKLLNKLALLWIIFIKVNIHIHRYQYIVDLVIQNTTFLAMQTT